MKKIRLLIVFIFLIAGMFLLIKPELLDNSTKKNILIRRNSVNKIEKYRWKGAGDFNILLASICLDGGGEINFPEGDFQIDESIKISNCNDLKISGQDSENKTVWRFPSNKAAVAKLTKNVLEGDDKIYVDDAGLFKIGSDYQIFEKSLNGDRILEFTVINKINEAIVLSQPISFMSHVSSIPADSLIFQQLNFLEITKSDGLSISNILFDGQNYGNVRGHTTYSAILFENNFIESINHNKAVSHNLTLRDNVFKNLKGRAVAIYAVDDVLIESNLALNINAEAFELDHGSGGIITRNLVDGASVGIQLNDTFPSLVSENKLKNVDIGINLISHFDSYHVNKFSVIVNNYVQSKKIAFFMDRFTKENIFLGNFIFSTGEMFLDKSGLNKLIDNNYE